VTVMWWNGGGFGWAGWLVMSLMMVIFWGLVIFGGIAVWRAASRGGRGQQRADIRSPEQLLDERFARGEIDVEEYTHRRELLRSGR
jgi:putative membrane protein